MCASIKILVQACGMCEGTCVHVSIHTLVFYDISAFYSFLVQEYLVYIDSDTGTNKIPLYCFLSLVSSNLSLTYVQCPLTHTVHTYLKN